MPFIMGVLVPPLYTINYLSSRSNWERKCQAQDLMFVACAHVLLVLALIMGFGGQLWEIRLEPYLHITIFIPTELPLLWLALVAATGWIAVFLYYRRRHYRFCY